MLRGIINYHFGVSDWLRVTTQLASNEKIYTRGIHIVQLDLIVTKIGLKGFMTILKISC